MPSSVGLAGSILLKLPRRGRLRNRRVDQAISRDHLIVRVRDLSNSLMARMQSLSLIHSRFSLFASKDRQDRARLAFPAPSAVQTIRWLMAHLALPMIRH